MAKQTNLYAKLLQQPTQPIVTEKTEVAKGEKSKKFQIIIKLDQAEADELRAFCDENGLTYAALLKAGRKAYSRL
jgi:hypothetical protein